MIKYFLQPVIFILALYFIRWYSGVLLFHTLAELFSVVVGILMFVIASNTKRFTRNSFLLYLGVCYFWIAILDTFHTFTLKGLPFFENIATDVTLHFWVYTRFLEALVLLTAPIFLKKKLQATMCFYLGACVTILVCFFATFFKEPVMLTEQGLTVFKINAEYSILIILLICALNFRRKKQEFSTKVLYLMYASISFTIIQELCFTLYTDFHGHSFVIGHIFKFLSFWYIYQAIVQTTLNEPFSVLAQVSDSYNAIPHPAVVVDREGLISQVNKAAEETFGRLAADIVHKPIHDFFHPNIPVEDCSLCQLIKAGKELANESHYFSEQDRWYLLSLSSMRVGDSRAGMVQSLTDITSQVKASQGLEEEICVREKNKREKEAYIVRIERQQELIVNFSSIDPFSEGLSTSLDMIVQELTVVLEVERAAVWFYDDEDNSLSCKSFFSRSEGLVTGTDVIDLINYPSYKKALECESLVIANDVSTYPATLELLEDYLIPNQISSMLDVTIRVNGKMLGTVCLEHVGEGRVWRPDEIIFAERMAEQIATFLAELELIALRDLRYEELEEKVHERTIELEEAKLLAEESNAIKGQFLANVSHEIRTPMNAILGFAEILKLNTDNSESLHCLDLINSSGEALLGLINDILDLSKIESGKVELELASVSMEYLIETVVLLLSKKAEEKNIKLISDYDERIPEFILLDELRLRQVLINLVSNAIKFTDSGFVRLTAKLCEKDEGTKTLILEVEDSGVGIEEDQQEKIFESFVQASGQDSRKYGGTGLGLSISKQLIDVMGGEMALESHVGRGSKFSMKIPIDEAVDGAVTNSVQELLALDFNGAKVLLASDDCSDGEIMENFLGRMNLELHKLGLGPEVFEGLEAFQADVILLEINPSVSIGLGFYKELYEISNKKQIKLVALTSSSFLLEEEQVLCDLCDGILTKPITMEALERELKKHLLTMPSMGKAEKVLKQENLSLEEEARVVKVCQERVFPLLKSLDLDPGSFHLISAIDEELKKIMSMKVSGEFSDWAEAFFLAAENFDNKAIEELCARWPYK